MDKFVKLIDTAIPIATENIDTDQIIPARFLKATDKKGFGDNVFRDWRYHKNGELNTKFILNNPLYGGSILLLEIILVAVLVENMRPGLCSVMVLR